MNPVSVLKHLGIRSRLIALIAIALAPLTILIATGIWIDRNEALERSSRELTQAAEFAASRQSQMFAETRIILDTLRHFPQVAVAGSAACDDIVTRMQRDNPQFHTLGVIDSDGMVTCHSILRAPQKFGEQSLVDQVKAPDAPEFLVGHFMVGRVSKKPTVAAMLALPKVNGKFAGAVFAAMNLDEMARIAEDSSDGGRRTISVVEVPSSKLLVRAPDISVPFGTPFVGHPFMDKLRSGGTASVEPIEGLDGIVRVYGFASVDTGEDASLVVAVGMEPGIVVAPVWRRAGTALIVTVVVLGVAILGMWWLAYWTQIRPMQRLTWTADSIGSGDFSARTALEPWQAPELLRLGDTIDAMAGKLETAHEAERVIAASEARYRLLADNMSDIVTCVGPDGLRVFVSPASREILGVDPEEMIGQRPRDIVFADDLPIVDAMMARLLAGHAHPSMQYRMKHRDGRLVWVEVGGRPLEGQAGVVLVVRDIRKRKEVEAHLEDANRRLIELASTDGLTNLRNRRAFDELLQKEFSRSRREKADLSLVMIDVDRFKAFNDTYGHPAGDECLRKIAAALSAVLRRPADHAARYGGEELAAILPNTALEGAVNRARIIREAVRDLAIPHVASEHGFVTISVGVTTVVGGADCADENEMLRRADEALYAAKAGGRDRVRVSPQTVALAS